MARTVDPHTTVDLNTNHAQCDLSLSSLGLVSFHLIVGQGRGHLHVTIPSKRLHTLSYSTVHTSNSLHEFPVGNVTPVSSASSKRLNVFCKRNDHQEKHEQTKLLGNQGYGYWLHSSYPTNLGNLLNCMS